jgi:hypothetical protein
MKMFHYFALVVCVIAFGCVRAEIAQTGSSYEKRSADQEGELYEYGEVSEMVATPQGVPIVGSEQPGDVLVVHQEQVVPVQMVPAEQPVAEGLAIEEQTLAQPEMVKPELVKPVEGQVEAAKQMTGHLSLGDKQVDFELSLDTKEANQGITEEQKTVQLPAQVMPQEQTIPAVATTPVATTPEPIATTPVTTTTLEDEQKIMKDMDEIK